MIARTSWAVVLLGVAALQFVPSYSGVAAPVALVLAVLLPFLLIRAGMALGLGGFASTLAVVLLGAFGAWWMLRDSGTFTDAVPRLLTTPRPTPATAALLAPVVLLVVLVAAVVALCVLAPGRVPGLIAPVLGAAGLYVAAALLSAGHADRHGIVAVCLLLVAAVGWSLPSLPSRPSRTARSARPRRVAWQPSALVPVVCVAVVGLGTAAAVPAANAFDPRRHVTPPTVELDQPNPLQLLSTWSRNPDVEILHASVTGTQRLHLATLSEFTGDTWRVAEHYRQLGLAVAPALPPGTQRTPVTAQVNIVRLGGLWLPAPGTPSSVSVGGALLDADDGTLARLTPVTPGLSYTVRALVDTPDAARLRSAGTPRSVPDRYLALPGMPSSFATYAQSIVRGATTPLEEAVALEHAVATDRTLAPTAPTGSSYARLGTFLFARDHGPGSQRGTSEQFAAAFAVLARAVGLPTRLVVGFVVPPGGVVRGRDAQVWPEVYFAGAGWVPFAPAPGTAGNSGDAQVRQSVLGQLAQRVAVIPPANAGETEAPPAPSASPAPAARRASSGGGAPVLPVAVALVLVAALLGTSAGLRRARTARHRRHGARGAWSEVLDLLVLLRTPASRTLPAPQLAADLDARLGAPGSPAARVAAAADRQAFGPDAVSAPVWSEVRMLRRRARAALPWYRRVLFAVDPRPLLRR